VCADRPPVHLYLIDGAAMAKEGKQGQDHDQEEERVDGYTADYRDD
jgi:hypothetical protein